MSATRSYAIIDPATGVIPPTIIPSVPAEHVGLAAHVALGVTTDTALTAHAQTPHGGTHPDLPTHTGLGLAAEHAHPFSGSGHDHAGLYEPTHAHPYETSGAVVTHAGLPDPHPGYLTTVEGDTAYLHAHPYAPTAHAHLDADIPAAIARDAEVTSAVATHAATPHGGSGTWTAVIKTADESKNSLAAVADDALLKFTTLPNTSYVVRLRAWFLTNATADLKYRLVHTGTTTRVRRIVRRTATTDIAQTIVLGTAFDAADVILSTTGLNPWIEEDVILQIGASGGVFKLQWGQVTSNAGPTTCLEGSYLEYALT